MELRRKRMQHLWRKSRGRTEVSRWANESVRIRFFRCQNGFVTTLLNHSVISLYQNIHSATTQVDIRMVCTKSEGAYLLQLILLHFTFSSSFTSSWNTAVRSFFNSSFIGIRALLFSTSSASYQKLQSIQSAGQSIYFVDRRKYTTLINNWLI